MSELFESFLNTIGTISPILFIGILIIGFIFSAQSARIFVSGVGASRAEAFSKWEKLRNYLANGDPESIDRQIPAV